MAIIAAAALFVSGMASPALAAPSARSGGELPSCIPIEDGDCTPVDAIDENTELYIASDPGGGIQGFTSFGNFASWARENYGVRFASSSDFLSGGSGGHGSGSHGGDDNGGDDNGGDDGPWPGGGDGDDDGPWPGGGDDDGDGPRFGWRAQFATFYDGSGLTGPGFVLDPPNKFFDLRFLPKPGGGSWNNRISSVRVIGGNPNKQGVVLCSRAQCASPGWRLFLNNGDATQLIGGFNNTATAVGVFG